MIAPLVTGASREAPSRLQARGWWPAAFALLLALQLVAAPPLAAARYDQGQRVEVTGIVSDPQGRPLSGIQVVLVASRNTFSFRELRRTDKDARRVAVTTNSTGEYRLEWPWDSYFNSFELLAGIPVPKGKSVDSLEVLERQDITRKMAAGSPVVIAVVVQNREFIDRFREFLASVKSDDERKVYGEMGKPDRVERVNYPDHVEATWWYFESGRAYRFRGGRLEQVVPFTPVTGR